MTEREFEYGDVIQVDDVIVKVTGFSGEAYRVFVVGTNGYHRWYPADYLESHGKKV